jgi:hypothetical protein
MSATRHPQVPAAILGKLQLICLDLPEAYEEQAWVGTRWMVRKKAFAHALMIEEGWPPAYAKVAAARGPLCVLTFRTAGPALDIPRFGQPPFFRPGWWPNIAGMAIDLDADWYDVAALLTTSYCVLAPRKLAALVDAATE